MGAFWLADTSELPAAFTHCLHSNVYQVAAARTYLSSVSHVFFLRLYTGCM